jgi:hypothetical protein
MNLVERLRGLGNRTVGILREPLIDAADRIEQLEAEVAALKKANAILQPEQQLARITEKCKQLAAHEATIAKLREAFVNFGHRSGCRINAFGDKCTCGIDEALSLPAPTDHLMAYRDSIIEECANRLSSLGFVGSSIEFVQCKCIDTIRAMKEKK